MGHDRWAVGSESWAMAHQSPGVNQAAERKCFQGALHPMNISFYNSTWGKSGWIGEYCHLQNNNKEKRQTEPKEDKNWGGRF